MEYKWSVPKTWGWVSIKALGEITGGATPNKSTPEYWGGDIPWVSPKDMKVMFIGETQDYITQLGVEDSRVKLIPVDSILIVFRSGILAHSLPIAIATKDLAINQDMKALIPRPAFDSRYIAYAILSRQREILKNCVKKGPTVHSLIGDSFWSERIPVPHPANPTLSLTEQRRIVARIEMLLEEVREIRRLQEGMAADADKLMDAFRAEQFYHRDSLPEGWERLPLGEVATINPRRPAITREDEALTTFVPMSAVDEMTGEFNGVELKPYGEVRRGFTYFEEDDVVFAKITPSMQNGKSAVARDLTDGIGFGTTEFHVIRSLGNVLPDWIHQFVRQAHFLNEAVKHFRGAVGQQRVPAEFLASYEIPVPFPHDPDRSLQTQTQIIELLKSVQSEVWEMQKDAKEEMEHIGRLEQAILSQAFRGEL